MTSGAVTAWLREHPEEARRVVSEARTSLWVARSPAPGAQGRDYWVFAIENGSPNGWSYSMNGARQFATEAACAEWCAEHPGWEPHLAEFAGALDWVDPRHR